MSGEVRRLLARLAPAWLAYVDTGAGAVDKSNLAVYREALSSHPKPL